MAQSPVLSCDAAPRPAWCSAVPGDRADGWMSQRRSEVMARNGVVATSQPLAAQAGLEILKRGGNAIDAAVTTAAMLTLVEPMIVGPGGDLFADHLHRAGEQALCAQRQRQGAERPDAGADERARLPLGSEELGTRLGHAARGILTATVPGAVWGWDEVLRRFGTMTFKETLQPAIDYAEQGFPVSERIAVEWRLPQPSARWRRCTRAAAPRAIPIRWPRGT